MDECKTLAAGVKYYRSFGPVAPPPPPPRMAAAVNPERDAGPYKRPHLYIILIDVHGVPVHPLSNDL